MTTKQTKPISVVIATPYLSDGIEHFASKGPAEVFGQIALCGYNPNNLAGVRALQSPKRTVKLLTRDDVPPDDVPLYDLCVIGMCENSERVVRDWKGTGLIVARYSIFHGKPSGYTGSTCEDAGYSLDLPKDVGLVQKLLTFDPFLSALEKREENMITKAIDRFNQVEKLEQCVLVTPHLAKALEARK